MRYGAVVPLASVCDELFGLNYAEARRGAALHELPVPTLRLRDSQKAPLLIRTSELAAYIDLRAQSSDAAQGAVGKGEGG